MKFRYSIVTRFALFFTALIIFSILLSGYLVFRKASGVIVAYSQDRINYSSEMAEQAFYALLNEVSNDIAVIANSPTLQEYVDNPSHENTADIDQLFRILLQKKPSYFQIRWIGVQGNGKEIIRFDKRNNEVFKSDTLQEKGDREYYRKSLELGQGEFYFSEINLNEEYGVISEPLTPTLRAASQIFNSAGQPMGILVINVNMNKLYETLDRIAGSDYQLYLIDSKGEYLYSPAEEDRFASQRNKSHNFYTDFNVDPVEKLSSHENFDLLKTENQIYLSSIKELEYFKGKRKVYLISSIEQQILLESARAVRRYSLRTLFVVCLLSILVSLIFTSFLSNKIKQITRAISNYEKGLSNNISLPVSRKDEIGILASSFAKMKTRIDENVEALNQSLEKEKHAKKQRDEFLQNMSHEMRTPLNSILGLTQILYKHSPSEAQLPIISSLEKSANNLAGLVYDVLDHQKLVEGKLQISHHSTNIAKLLKDIHSSYQFEAVQKGLTFTLSLDKKLEENKFKTDPLRLSQIVTNLVVNALKYTREGKIDLTAKIISFKTETPVLEIEVKDTGIGIESENISRINDRFFREKEDLSGRYSGYGLGLSIVKQLTELFGGELQAKSTKGSGSEFYVTIPVTIAGQEHMNKDQVARQTISPRLANVYNILLIEDDLSTVELIKHILDDNKITLQQVDHLNAAVEILNTSSPDLVISDLMLEDKNLQPILTDWVNLKKIKCPLVVASALEPGDLKKVSPFYFQKPYNPKDLNDRIYQLLGKNEFPIPDFSNIYSNYDNDSDKVSRVLKLLHEEFHTYLERIYKAAEKGDQKEWEAILHKLITHINNLALHEFREILPKKVALVNRAKLETIHDHFAYYLCCIRTERYSI
ncbi:ATP-binding protein [Autumnicola psychrophila]|uniref:histidine kinase n=1 Tax=Autumnicola psychrophila TaxID=3075592 RepID=A0ABU3DNW1_9FLAO|nr:ATP-binding protein [Zunongwangia sp. F225]MDT0685404.1 ATP-binding protein [Zunongwangia sp. F225]